MFTVHIVGSWAFNDVVEVWILKVFPRPIVSAPMALIDISGDNVTQLFAQVDQCRDRCQSEDREVINRLSARPHTVWKIPAQSTTDNPLHYCPKFRILFTHIDAGQIDENSFVVSGVAFGEKSLKGLFIAHKGSALSDSGAKKQNVRPAISLNAGHALNTFFMLKFELAQQIDRMTFDVFNIDQSVVGVAKQHDV
jgi:hypothetical protein